MPVQVNSFKPTDTVGEIVARRPALSRVFEKAGIDYCCGGKKSLEEACRRKGIDAAVLLAALEEAGAKDSGEPAADILSMSQAELADHIEHTHHAYLKSEIPRIRMLADKVATVHGAEEARLLQVRDIFHAFVRDLVPHLAMEEESVFPGIRARETGATLSDAILKLESEHEEAGTALERLRELTDGYAPPDWACNSYRALFDALARLEHDMHQHVHKENNVLYPRTLNGGEGKPS